MSLTDTEAAVLRHLCSEPFVPERLAEELGVTLGEIREAEKTALRKLSHPERLDAAGAEALGELTDLESAVIAHGCRGAGKRTPEAVAEQLQLPVAVVLEAEKTALRKVQRAQRSSGEH